MNEISRIHPKLRPYVMALVSHEFGLQEALPEITKVECGSIVTKRGKRWGDRFHLRMLYCETRLTWQVIMCPYNLMKPPDFIMEDDFLADADFSLIESNVPSLVNWDPTDPKCLLNVVLELLQLYKHFQAELLTINRDSRLYFEYEGLLNSQDISFSDLETYVHNAARVTFLTHLKIDYSKLPTPMPKQKYLTLLTVDVEENAKNVVSLRSKEELDNIFGNIDLPELGIDMLLIDYIQFIKSELQLKVDEIVHRLNMRKMLYCYLLQAFEPAILNGDMITFQNVSFLLELNGFYYVFLIGIPLTFPDNPPELNVTSMRKYRNGTPLFVNLKKFNYDQNWNVEKIFKNFYDYIKKAAIPQFNKLSSTPDMKSKK